MTETTRGAGEDTTKPPQDTAIEPAEPKGPVQPGMTQSGTRAFLWTLAVLAALVVAYAVAHVSTFRDHGQVHYEAGISADPRQDLLVTAAVLEGQLETPTAIADPAIQALLHDLEQSVARSETSGEVTDQFGAAAESLANLGIRAEVARKMLQPAQSQGTRLVSASAAEREVPRLLLQAELATAQAWALDALGAETLVDEVKQLKEVADNLGYGAGSEVGQTLASIEQELGAERPNRRLVQEMSRQVAERVRGPQSLFWSHPVLRWLEVMAWSLAGILVARLWVAGYHIYKGSFDPRWNWWWWAKIIQAPLLAVAVVLALSYLELGLASGETLAIKVSLRDQPIEVIVAISFVLGLFSDRAYQFLRDLADKVLGEEKGGEVPGGTGGKKLPP
ncbi:MAG TPA: hypothetical protein VM537_33320 [Anaerolineae bacterium]|nr:hypothetical protein [Anaerolineae bacterium]